MARNNNPKIKSRSTVDVEWKSFKKGLNLLLRETELDTDEMAQADNILITGDGIATGRWGTEKYFSVNSTGTIRGFGVFKNNLSGTNELIALSDEGYLAKKAGITSTIITGISYPSGSIVRSEQLGGYTYFVSDNQVLSRYNGSTLSIFATISAPTGLAATNYSGATGSFTWSWKVTATSDNSETDPSTEVTLPDLPQELDETQINISWNLCTEPGVQGYQIYRGLPGDETLLAFVGASTSQFIDTGQPESETVFPPSVNNTGGIKSKFIKKFRDRLLVVDATDPNKLFISGRYPYQDRFNWQDGGGYIYIDPDSGDDITALEVQPGTDKIVVYKNNSHYGVVLSVISIGNYAILDASYEPISNLIGCSSQDSVKTVENDTFYFGRKGLYVTGYEPNFLNVIRTNEVSARLRPFLDTLSDDDYNYCNAMYVDNKYILSFPGKKQAIVYDRERGAFAGKWIFPFGINHQLKYIDSTGTEQRLIGSSDSNYVYKFNENISNDDGEIIGITLRTNKETFKLWNALKLIQQFVVSFRSISGSVTVNLLIEDRSGSTTTTKSFTISGASVQGSTGWGVFTWGDKTWGDTQGDITISSGDIQRMANIFRKARVLQIEVTTNLLNSNFELISLYANAKPYSIADILPSNRI